MKTNLLLPHRYQRLGWILLLPTAILMIVVYVFRIDSPDLFEMSVFAIADVFPFQNEVWFGMTTNNVMDEILTLLFFVGALLVVFSRERTEDELISRIRMESLIWATLVNYAILALAVIFLYSLAFLQVLIFNMFTILVFFIIRFRWMMYKTKKLASNEE
jgi:hypothetical protein